MTAFFIFMAIVAFLAFGFHAQRRNGHGMAYAAAICGLWTLLALWWSGAIG